MDLTKEYISWLNDPEVVRHSNQRFRVHTIASSQEYLKSFERTHNLFLSVKMRDTATYVGTMTAYISKHHRVADMGILIGNREFWGKGIGLDAWATLMQYLFNSIGLRKITGGTLRDNTGMVKIMERSGMHLEGIRRDQELVAGKPQDLLYFAKFHE
ncbi:GNAT family N-acetyltransferase [bacterium]|nr:GNAT family N-acetyltransferase [bacterium]